jgi:anti-anti-sigma regulatory factor
MKLEGKLTGPWVEECMRVWLELKRTLSTRKLALDLCGVTFVDALGMQLLREIYSATRAEFRTNSPLTNYFAEQAMQQISDGRKGA